MKWSSPNHQNQSEPSAASSASQASRASSRGRSRFDERAARAASSSHARFFSGCPIQMRKSALIHDPEWRCAQRRDRSAARRGSRTACACGCPGRPRAPRRARRGTGRRRRGSTPSSSRRRGSPTRPGASPPRARSPIRRTRVEEVGRPRPSGVPVVVDEADAVGELVVAEEQRDLSGRGREPPRAVERRRAGGGRRRATATARPRRWRSSGRRRAASARPPPGSRCPRAATCPAGAAPNARGVARRARARPDGAASSGAANGSDGQRQVGTRAPRDCTSTSSGRIGW